jgi:putative NADH-flavin reductase
MRLTLFGATGGTGQHVLRQALAAGHHVTAVVRDPARLPAVSSDHFDVVVADVMRADEITPALAGHDAAISALGPRRRGPTTVSSAGAHAILEAMWNANLTRIVVVTGSGHVTDAGDGPLTRLLLKPVIGRLFLRDVFADFGRTEQLVMGSGQEWTIMRPPRLTDGGRRPYRTALDRNVRGGLTLSRADLADAILTAVADPGTIGHTIGLGY